ncbi:MAG TPA: ThuA domain-containing protein [Gemmataceae bacterium]|nr:ThuA domain-containing protein [Gemmataceae bacterium]
MIRRIIALAAAGLAVAALASDVDPYDQSGVPLEKQPTDPSLSKIVLVAGHKSHGPREHEFFAGCAILKKMLEENPGVAVVMARDDWPKNPADTFKDAKAVVLYMDGGDHHPAINSRDHEDAIQKLIDAKVGFCCLHYAVEYPKAAADPVLNWLGGYYETGYSINPTWTADFKSLPDHPITRGVKPFPIKDEWYYNIRFNPDMKGVTPILKATPPDSTRGTAAAKEHPGREEVMAWAFDRPDGGRSFGFTGGHYHDNWGDENFRRLVVNAILWSANIDVPKEGAKVDFDPADLNKNLDDKRKK